MPSVSQSVPLYCCQGRILCILCGPLGHILLTNSTFLSVYHTIILRTLNYLSFLFSITLSIHLFVLSEWVSSAGLGSLRVFFSDWKRLRYGTVNFISFPFSSCYGIYRYSYLIRSWHVTMFFCTLHLSSIFYL